MSQQRHKEKNDFSQKVSRQGKTAFGAGPWPEPEKIEVAAPAAVSRPTPGPAPPAPALTRADQHPPCRLGDRILTGLAILALGMLIIGAMGAYLSNDSQRVATRVSGDTVMPASALAAASDARYRELTNRLTELNERYGQRLHVLETKVEQSVDPYAARLAKIETRLESAGNSTGNEPQDAAGAPASFDASGFEARLSAIESRLDQENAPYQAELREMKNRIGHAYSRYDARLREMENRLMQIQIPYEQRIQALEQQLMYASARLDYLSSEMDTMINNNAVLAQASATLENDPPAALPVPPAVARPVAARPPTWPPVAPAAPSSMMANDTSQTMTAPVADARPSDGADAAVKEAAADAVKISVPADPIPEPAAQDPVPPPAPETTNPMVDATVPTGAVPSETTAVPQADTRLTAAPPTLAHADTTRAPPETVEAAADVLRRDKAPSVSGGGDWFINLASYASESIAARKLADFKRKGVNAEQSVATVNGRTIYRVRIAGFDTRKSAVERAETVRAQLGLKETWISRR